jgi:hypothetical protein
MDIRYLAPLLILLVALGPLSPGQAGQTFTQSRIAVPAYFSSSQSWSMLANSFPTVGIAILDPQSGPGSAPNPELLADVQIAQSKGVLVIGYVATAYAAGGISLTQAEAWIGDYYSWYNVDGVFVDEVSSSCATTPLAYYTQLHQFVKSEPGAAYVVLNPGQATGECYASISDVIITFEGNYDAYVGGYHAAPWTALYQASHFWNVVYGAATAAEMNYVLNLAAQRGTGWIYTTDSQSYSQPPPYFEQEVSTILQQSILRTRLPMPLPSTPTFDRWDSMHYIT